MIKETRITYSDLPLTADSINKLKKLPPAQIYKLFGFRMMENRSSVHLDKRPEVKSFLSNSSQYNDLIVCKISDKIGYGVFSSINISKGTIICEYIGEVVMYQEGLQYPCSVVNLYNRVIDSSKFGNISHFINHAPEDNKDIWPLKNIKTANLSIMINNDGRVFLVAITDIKPYDELTFDYGPMPWKGKEDSMFFFSKHKKPQLLTPGEAYLKQGNKYLKHYNYKLAIHCFKKAYKYIKNDSQILWNLVKAYQETQEFDKVCDILLAIKKHFPDNITNKNFYETLLESTRTYSDLVRFKQESYCKKTTINEDSILLQ